MPLISRTSDVVYLAPNLKRITGRGGARHTFQVMPRNSAVLKVNVCSTTPVVFNRAFKTSTVVHCQLRRKRRDV